MTEMQESKLNSLCVYIDDEALAESLARKLTEKEVSDLVDEFRRACELRTRFFCERVMRLPRLKDRMEALEKGANPPEATEARP